jgi:hypothetical protein
VVVEVAVGVHRIKRRRRRRVGEEAGERVVVEVTMAMAWRRRRPRHRGVATSIRDRCSLPSPELAGPARVS